MLFMKKHITPLDVVSCICKQKFVSRRQIKETTKEIFAPINIALIKYWGKTDDLLRLPTASSLSYTSKYLGSTTILSKNTFQKDIIIFNGKDITNEYGNTIKDKIVIFIALFKEALSLKDVHFTINTRNNIPTKSGLASSASGFASLVLALNDILSLKLSNDELSILARLGSGSACRSVYLNKMFVLWQKGRKKNGLDSFAKPIDFPNFIEKNICAFVVKITEEQKSISSTDAMNMIDKNSNIYKRWVKETNNDLKRIFLVKSFQEFGEIVEKNAMRMHNLINKCGVNYFLPETMCFIDFIKNIRKTNQIDVYITIDAGANVKIICEKKNCEKIKQLIKTNFQHEMLDF